MGIRFLKSLIELRMANNEIQGSILSDEFDDLVDLRLLDLSSNYLHGRLPQLSCLELEHLDLSCNSFIGEIPSDYKKLRCLKVLNLCSNRCLHCN